MVGPARSTDRGCEYFKIGEVARALDITPSAIRFYQKRFALYIRPTLSQTNRHLFSRRDVQVLKVILILRREYGLSVRGTLERFQDLLVAHNRDPFAIEQALIQGHREPEPTPDQGELPLDAPSGPSRSGLREPDAEFRAVERELEEVRGLLQARERELADVRRSTEEQTARVRNLERALRRLEAQTNALRLRIGQAVREMLLDVSGDGAADGS